MNNYENYISKLHRPSTKKKINNDFVRLDRNEPPFSAFEIIDGFLSNDELKSLNHYPELYIYLHHVPIQMQLLAKQ